MWLLLVCYILYFLSLWFLPDHVLLTTKISLFFSVLFFIYFGLKKRRLKQLLRRLVDASFTIVFVALVCFILVRLIPGTPLALDELSPEVQKQLVKTYDLDQPIFIQLKNNVAQLVQGDLGESLVSGRKISYILSYYVPRSLQLGVIALVFCILLSFLFLFIKIFFVKDGSRAEQVYLFVLSSQMAMPSFLVAALLSYILAYNFSLLPMGLWLGPSHYLLPALSLCVRPASILTELLINSVESELGQNYVQALKAKGVSRTRVILKHILPVASLSALGFLGPLASSLLTGSFVIEYMFAIPGAGSLMVDSVLNRDYPVILVMTLLFCILLQFFNFLSDVLSEYLNPQVEAL